MRRDSCTVELEGGGIGTSKMSNSGGNALDTVGADAILELA
jgi:hypothetical protein